MGPSSEAVAEAVGGLFAACVDLKMSDLCFERILLHVREPAVRRHQCLALPVVVMHGVCITDCVLTFADAPTSSMITRLATYPAERPVI
jgi:hypothetical protein